MANFTKQAIETAFLQLLNEKPLNKISVRDIVEKCGINRNSFYYHFQDIPPSSLRSSPPTPTSSLRSTPPSPRWTSAARWPSATLCKTAAP